MEQLDKLVEISRFYGKNKDYVIAGGGNTSYKNDKYIWIKASGTSLATIDANGFVKLDRGQLSHISEKHYSTDPMHREAQVKNDLNACVVENESHLRPSVETSLHDLFNYSFIVHTHPNLVNGLVCSKNSKKNVLELFGDETLYIPYVDPGYTLFKKVEEQLQAYRQQFSTDPHITFLENHGVFVGADTIEEIKQIYTDIEQIIFAKLPEKLDIEQQSVGDKAKRILPALRMLLSEDNTKILKIRNNSLISHYYQNQDMFRRVSLPFVPDIIVYCKSKYIYVESTGSVSEIISRFKQHLERFVKEYGYQPKVVLIKEVGLIAIEDTDASAEIVLDVYEDLMKISYYAEFFGGQRFLNPVQISFIDTWEVENYRRKVSKGHSDKSVVENKIAIVTGGAQGFGAGIAKQLFVDGANVVIADINEEVGLSFVDSLNDRKNKNKAVFIKTDISDETSVQEMITTTVHTFGGLDIFISNAGILRAGGLDEMDPETFDLMTKVNYQGYFICAKFASEILKIQSTHKEDYFSDIIQINSKSGLKGSNKNFAYAGGKFGGIGLTQSFALELVPFRIKVNSVCPGNFFEGPLWSDPKTGLFVQYLNAGKVPGAKSIEDVKKFYESQVPLKRGCRVEDVMKAIYYVIHQKYETGQAIPVTGGQIMLK
jgi:rhamnose utilization protein RhaD (predicted bifunctional aldolase and dehydrogenase)/NAD(P)-dependent dehydrogenase (short-subunit alcohol dehydrogenase family)